MTWCTVYFFFAFLAAHAMPTSNVSPQVVLRYYQPSLVGAVEHSTLLRFADHPLRQTFIFFSRSLRGLILFFLSWACPPRTGGAWQCRHVRSTRRESRFLLSSSRCRVPPLCLMVGVFPEHATRQLQHCRTHLCIHECAKMNAGAPPYSLDLAFSMIYIFI